MSEFRERAMQRLQAERGGADTPMEQVEPVVEQIAEEEQEVVESALDVESEEVEALPEGEQAEVAEDETLIDSEGEEGAPVEEDAGQIREQLREEVVAEVEEYRKEVQADYTRKTQQIAQTGQALEENLQQVEATAEFYVNYAKQQLEQFNNVNWQQLPPEEYQAKQLAFQTAQNNANTLMQAAENVRAGQKQMLEDAKRKEAAIGAEVLRSMIPSWGPQRFTQVQEHAAKNLGFTAEEVAQITDWRVMALLESNLDVSEKAAKVKTLKKTGAVAPKGKRTKPVAVRERNAKGQYLSARDRAFSHPGDRQSFREMKLAALKNERSR